MVGRQLPVFCTALLAVGCGNDGGTDPGTYENLAATYVGSISETVQGVALQANLTLVLTQSGGTLSGTYGVTGSLSDTMDTLPVRGAGTITGHIAGGQDPSVNLTTVSETCDVRVNFSGTYNSGNRAISLTATIPILNVNTCEVAITYPNSVVILRPFAGRITFGSNRDGDFEVYVMDADVGVARLTDDQALDVSPYGGPTPAWSPDGSRIAFSSDRDGDFEIYVMNADGTNVVQVTNDPAFDGEPAWSQDGSRIAFYSDRDGDNEIYVVNADGTNVVQLTVNTAFDSGPEWSPDGSRIAFSSDRDGDPDIYVMNADGTNVLQLTNSPGFDVVPAWSPDGSRIAFRSDRDGDPEVFVMDSDGTNVLQLTHDEAFDTRPDWSPDGSCIVFSSDRDGDFDIYVMNANGMNVWPLIHEVGTDLEPAWR